MKNEELEKLNINSEILKKATLKFENDKTYSNETNLLKECLILHKENKNINDIALKLGIIDITNSTHLSQYKSSISIYDLAKHIQNIKNIDVRLANGDVKLIDEIAATGNINLLSFASKFCFYQNRYIYKKDDYSIYDGVLANILPIIFKNEKYKNIDISYKNKKVELCNKTIFYISNYLKKYNYETFHNAIGYLLKDIKLKDKRWEFDRLIWHNNK